MGGYWPIRITSIRLIEETKNFKLIIGALYYLDAALSGRNMMNRREVNKKWTGIIKDLFAQTTSEKVENTKKYDNYVYSSFDCFVKHKTKLVFNLECLLCCNLNFRNLVLGQLLKISGWEDIALIKEMLKNRMDMNLPKKQVLTIFHNVQQLELDLNNYPYLHVISLSSLLSNIRSHPSLKMVGITLGYGRYNDSLRSLYSYALSPEMRRKYENAGYNIHLEERMGDIYCVIKRKK